MRFVIVGAGSIGLLIGSYLAQHKADVTFWVRRKEQADQLRKGLVRLEETGGETIVSVRTAETPEELPTDALWIIAVKYDALQSVLHRISALPGQPDLLFIQNGMGHLALIEKLKLGNTSFATVEHGAGRINDRTVRHNGIGPITIAISNEKMTETVKWLEQIDPQQFPIAVQQDAEELLLRKALINCAINPLTAILQVRNGQLIENTSFHELFQKLSSELLSNFPELSAILTYEDMEAVCRKTAGNQSSMLTDRLKGNPMEIESIITAVLERIRQKGGQAPLLDTLEKMLLGLNRGDGI
ncbi:MULTISPECIES: ketopantoate reductase family protein [Sporosarcina]|uniref:ketopantoate reductase family protein n=1 Tax=Sporosarcina TaxID=1569 RepID=UPI00129B537F|nr:MULTISPECIES: 2-dehydropantoate 2-reductase [Sporosarcina]GKV64289.1 putative 2-dehydropantoate 2-reductase [Sporosarcina sp. NCCP-2331]GLB54247.1 putative 2-dehydropantoate 2-reductase [Sporosarcina sp. NCCP-2378]